VSCVPEAMQPAKETVQRRTVRIMLRDLVFTGHLPDSLAVAPRGTCTPLPEPRPTGKSQKKSEGVAVMFRAAFFVVSMGNLACAGPGATWRATEAHTPGAGRRPQRTRRPAPGWRVTCNASHGGGVVRRQDAGRSGRSEADCRNEA
jgi:hypothetical protein